MLTLHSQAQHKPLLQHTHKMEHLHMYLVMPSIVVPVLNGPGTVERQACYTGGMSMKLGIWNVQKHGCHAYVESACH